MTFEAQPGPLLLTPGPLSTAAATRRAMLYDWGSRDPAFAGLTARIRARLATLVQAGAHHAVVPIQGSGTYAVEAMLASLLPIGARLLVVVNGIYGERIVQIAQRQGKTVVALRGPWNRSPSATELDRILRNDTAITHVAVVHCETTTGVLNELDALAQVVAEHGRPLFVDAMSTFGAMPINLSSISVAALVFSSNKCLEGPPGVGFVIADKHLLAGASGSSPSLSLDLHDQWSAMERTGQWRFTPPVQVVAALDAALDALDEEGGPAGRLRRYRANMQALLDGMERLGLRPYVDASHQSPIIATFPWPAHFHVKFDALYQFLRDRGFVIYRGAIPHSESFRVGCIGAVTPADLANFVSALGDFIRKSRIEPDDGRRAPELSTNQVNATIEKSNVDLA